ncbi:MAG: hypothetical protein CME63_15585 [Halobacteriovoraceae bacterium]|nr:hypothetical protein [Halobacteriovoraceae bacterium]MBC99163.1 hypothetical protein [Halobacteriovoraceae bacterium]|tara:strand:- start:206914 stop:207792 length:879 start_codon:yes stop_codon:yes gene_type:complete
MKHLDKLLDFLGVELSTLGQEQLLHILSTLILIFLVWSTRNIFNRSIRKSNWRMEEKRKWYVTIRNWSSMILLFGFISIWSTEIQTFAVSVVAVSAALIISGKEIILCIHGGLLRSLNGLFKIGDRIEIDGIRGDVIDTNLFVTKLMEIGPQNFTHQFTGRSINIPNALFLTKEVINESFMHKYVLHVFKMAFKRDEDLQFAEKCMKEAADLICGEFVEKAQRNMDQIRVKEEIEVPRAEPRITFRFPNATEVEMIIRIPSPASKKGNLEQAVLREFMKRYQMNTINRREDG